MSTKDTTKPKMTSLYIRDQGVYKSLQKTIQDKYYTKFGEKLTNGEMILRALNLMNEYLDGTLELKRKKSVKDMVGRILE